MGFVVTATRRSSAKRSRRGIVLVAAVGILGVLSVMALSFTAVMRLESRATRNFTNAARAEFVARAGIEDAIARLRSIARDGAESPYEEGSPAGWYTWRGSAGGGPKISFPATEATNGLDDDGNHLVDADDPGESPATELGYTDWVSSSLVPAGDNYTLSVQDAASKINVNAGDNLGTILDNLCRVVGPPLVAADQRALVPRWFADQHPQYEDPTNAADVPTTSDLFYQLDADGRPAADSTGRAVYGDGFSIAGHRARHGAFLSVEDVRGALTWVERDDGDGDGLVEPDTPEERMEVEAKFAALRPHLTVDSWSDTDQVGYGKFEHVHTTGAGRAVRLVDRNRTWNVSRKEGAGELKGCYVAIVNGVGQGQFKTIARNTIDTIFLDNSVYPGSEMVVPPNPESSYVIVGRDHAYDSTPEEWYHEARLYSRQPLSVHRAPVNVNTATDKVLTALLLGLQTNWGPAGYYTNESVRAVAADWYALCPSVLSVGRDGWNALLSFRLPCPNDSRFASRLRDPNLARHGHRRGGPPYCHFCNYGAPLDRATGPGYLSEAHYLAWQIIKEREQAREQDERSDVGPEKHSNGYGPFKGWDDLYFRVFRPWERAAEKELCVDDVPLDTEVTSLPRGGVPYHASLHTGARDGSGSGHPGIARLCMANFNSNTDILKFQPNIEWINRWGPNFTELYIPHPEYLGSGRVQMEGQANRDLKLRVRPGELLDKTDLNIGTTEFTFDSGGVYEIASTGRVYDEQGVVAEKKYVALVRIYDVWRESTQREFVSGEIKSAPVNGAGTALAGQVAADRVSLKTPRGGAVARKTLCTYPEPIVPGAHKGASGGLAPLALSRSGRNVKPAGYDGQIMLATNMLMLDETESPDKTVTFYSSFTGQVGADMGRGDRAPVATSLDEVGLLGALDSTELDVTPLRDTTGQLIEGEGKCGDLRPDGVYLGVVGSSMKDGSYLFESAGNFQTTRGVISMWVKPNFHHGTYMKASMPITYLGDPSREKGSTVTISRYNPNWPTPSQLYRTEGERSPLGYVRDRFEHEFFNATIPGKGAKAVHNFSFSKAGDFQHCGISPGVWSNDRDASPTGALLSWIENTHDYDSWFQIPGFLHTKDSRPYYRLCPFRWHFLGLVWNYYVPNRAPFQIPKPPGILATGTPWERGRAEWYQKTVHKGATYGEDPCPEGTKDRNLSLVLQGRLFVDTMRSWNKPIQRYSGATHEERLQAWAYDQYSHVYGDSGHSPTFPLADPPSPKWFGVNRARPENEHLYNRRYSGTYATIDELTISSSWKDARIPGPSGLYWPQERRKAGRYYFDRTGRNRAQFRSQSLFCSERSQSYAFAEDERDELIELGTVRWTVFTPYYCIHQPGLSDFEFPYDSYFVEAQSSGLRTRKVSQSWRPGPARWAHGPRSRNSSQRGCTVSIESGPSRAPTDMNREHTDPEAWAPILAAGARGIRHARSTPATLRYLVRFGFSREEYLKATVDSLLLDTPVFDDITITYMRRPKILTWREVSE